MNDQQGSREIVLRLALWFGVAMLAALGIIFAVGRAVSVAHGGLTYDQIQQLLPAGMAQEGYEFDRWFADHSVVTFLHALLGGIFLTLAPLQFSSRIRNRYLRFHRWSGRVLVLVALPVGLSGLLLAALFPYGGLAAASAAFVAGALFLVALIRAFIAIRRRDVARHRKWMIRMFSIGLGIATIRIVSFALFAITGARVQDTIGISFWIGWVSTFAAAEFWIRQTRPRIVPVGGTSITATVA